MICLYNMFLFCCFLKEKKEDSSSGDESSSEAESEVKCFSLVGILVTALFRTECTKIHLVTIFTFETINSITFMRFLKNSICVLILCSDSHVDHQDEDKKESKKDETDAAKKVNLVF